jgi:hypothetical protein
LATVFTLNIKSWYSRLVFDDRENTMELSHGIPAVFNDRGKRSVFLRQWKTNFKTVAVFDDGVEPIDVLWQWKQI